MYPNLFDRLAEEGHGYEPWTEEDLKKLAGLNLIRVFKDVERVSAEIKQRNVKPYEQIIPDVDLTEAGDQSCRSDISSSSTLRTMKNTNNFNDGC